MKVSKLNNSQIARRKNQFLPRLVISIIIIVTVFLLVFFISRKIIKNINSVPSISKVYEEWNSGNYENVINLTNKILEKIVESIQELIDDKHVEKGSIESIGIGAAGQVDRKNEPHTLKSLFLFV